MYNTSKRVEAPLDLTIVILQYIKNPIVKVPLLDRVDFQIPNPIIKAPTLDKRQNSPLTLNLKP